MKSIGSRKLASAALLAAAACLLVWESRRSDDPFYQGKRLSVWLADCNPKLEYFARRDGAPDREERSDTRRALEAADALRAMGTNAVPYLLKLASSGPSVLWSKAESMQLDQWVLIHLKSRGLYDWMRSRVEKPWSDHRCAENGFKTLGQRASPAVPQLIRLLKSPDWDTKETAADALGAIGPAAQEAVPALIQCINDPNERVEDAAVEALFAIGMKPEVAVPALARLLEADEGDFDRAMHLLANFGPDAKAAVPAILPFLEVQDTELRARATNVLKQIDPATAIP
jgi:HEAT repeat protein